MSDGSPGLCLRDAVGKTRVDLGVPADDSLCLAPFDAASKPHVALAEVTFQVLLTYGPVNCRRMAELRETSYGPPRAVLCRAEGSGW